MIGLNYTDLSFTKAIVGTAAREIGLLCIGPAKKHAPSHAHSIQELFDHHLLKRSCQTDVRSIAAKWGEEHQK